MRTDPPPSSTRLLIVLSGLPGTGKTALARELAPRLGALHLRIDTIEQALRNAGVRFVVGDEGYRVAYALAEDNLRLGHAVIADSVNPLGITRDAWHAVADRSGALCCDVEIVCTEVEEHRRRVETRESDLEGLKLPAWQDVLDREYHAWEQDRLIVDTASMTPAQCAQAIQDALAEKGVAGHAGVRAPVSWCTRPTR